MVLSATQHCSIEQAEHVEMCVNDDFITQSQLLQHVLLLYNHNNIYSFIAGHIYGWRL